MRILALLLTFFLVGCGAANSPPKTGVPLHFGLTSFTSKSSVAAAFIRQHRTEVIEDSALEPGDSRPPFSIYTVRVLDISDEGVPGELRLDFFNDRLMGVWFYPDDVSAYRRAMTIDSSRDPMNPRIETWTAEDYRGKWYVAWEDKALREQRDNWINQYA